MLTIFESFALTEIGEQVRAIDGSLRSVLVDAQRRIDEFNPGTAETDYEQELIEQHGQGLMDDLAVAQGVVKSSMGVLPILIYSHVETGLNRIFNATRCSPLNTHRWEKFVAAYESAGITLEAIPHVDVVHAMRTLANCYKHSAGVSKHGLLLWDGMQVVPGSKVDFSSINYLEGAEMVVHFLRSVGEAANNPPCPKLEPKITVEILANGEHKIVRRRSFLESRDQLEVHRLIAGSRRGKELLGVYETDSIVLGGALPGARIIYWFNFVNSKGEVGPAVRVVV